MAFPPSFLDEIRARVSLYDVVGRRVTWDRRKSNPHRRDWWACCPFHGEKSPSFHVLEDEGRYYCFGCGAKGNVFDFIMAMENLSFPETVEMLAGEAGLRLPEQSPRAREAERRKASLHEVMDLAARFFMAELAGARGAAAKAYARERRQLDDETIARFRVGYAPRERHALIDALTAGGVEMPQLIETGLVIRPDDGGRPYDRFRDRVMFPIEDARGRVIAFGGRALSPDAHAKYLNSPETPLFHKTQVLYNFRAARAAAPQAGRIVVAEGYMDVIAFHRAGIAEAVAPLGTALTEEQLALLWKASEAPILCLDGDKAGIAAAYRAIDRALPLLSPGQTLRFASLPPGQDPDDLLAAAGPEAVHGVLDKAVPLVDMLWRREWEQVAIATPESRAGLLERLRAAAGQIQHAELRRFYEQELVGRAYEAFRSSRPGGGAGRGAGGADRGGRGGASGFRRAPGGNGRLATSLLGGESGQGWQQPVPVSRHLLQGRLMQSRTPTMELRESLLLGFLVHCPQLLASVDEDLAGIEFTSPGLAELRDAMLEFAQNSEAGFDRPSADEAPDPSAAAAAPEGRGDAARESQSGQKSGGPLPMRREDLDETPLVRHLASSENSDLALKIARRPEVRGAWSLRRSEDVTEIEAFWREEAMRHARASILHGDLEDAKTALVQNPSEQNELRLRLVLRELDALGRTQGDVADGS